VSSTKHPAAANPAACLLQSTEMCLNCVSAPDNHSRSLRSMVKVETATVLSCSLRVSPGYPQEMQWIINYSVVSRPLPNQRALLRKQLSIT
jgi:hypothetical protein